MLISQKMKEGQRNKSNSMIIKNKYTSKQFSHKWEPFPTQLEGDIS